jgi:hypothetical protein
MTSLDAVILEVLWNRLISIVDETGATLQRTSFSTIGRESNFAVRGEMPDEPAHPERRRRGPAGAHYRPVGCLLNPTYPAAVGSRAQMGHLLPAAIFGALAPVISERVAADSGSPLWGPVFSGTSRGHKFSDIYFFNGGQGARPISDGIHRDPQRVRTPRHARIALSVPRCLPHAGHRSGLETQDDDQRAEEDRQRHPLSQNENG